MSEIQPDKFTNTRDFVRELRAVLKHLPKDQPIVLKVKRGAEIMDEIREQLEPEELDRVDFQL